MANLKANLDDFEILYENTIALHSKTKSTKVIIVDHFPQKCIEIVAYNALISLETARLYINAALLIEKINCMPDFAIKMSSTLEAREASSQHFDFPAFRKDLLKSFIVKYILARLDIPKDLARGSFSILLNPIEDDLKDKHGRLDVVRNMPNNLKIYEFDHNRRGSVVQQSEMKSHEHKHDTVRLPALGKSTFGSEGNHSILRDHRHSIDAHVTADHKHDNSGGHSYDFKHDGQTYHNTGHGSNGTSSSGNHHVAHSPATAAQDKHHLSPLINPSATAAGPPMRNLLKKQGSMDDSFIMENTNGLLRGDNKKFTSPRSAAAAAAGAAAMLEAKRGDTPKTPAVDTPSSVNGIAGSDPNTPLGAGGDLTSSGADEKKSIRRVLKRQTSIQELIEGKNINNLPPLSNRRGSLSKQAPGSHNNLFHGNRMAAEDLSASEDEESDAEEGGSGSGKASKKHTPTNAHGKELLVREHSDHIPGLKLVVPGSGNNNNMPNIMIPSDENVASPSANALIDAPSSRRSFEGGKKSVPGAIKNFKRQFDVVAQMTENLNLKLSALDPNTPTYARQTLTSLIQISEEKTLDQRRRASLGEVPSTRRILQPLTASSTAGNNNSSSGGNGSGNVATNGSNFHSEDSVKRNPGTLPGLSHK